MSSLLPLSIVPPVAYFSAVMHSQNTIIDLGENYIHQTIRNRYHIAGPNGVIALTLNVKSQNGLKIPTGEIELDYSKPWQRLHLRTIEAAYRSAPFYDHYIAFLQHLLSGNETTLGELFTKAWPLWLRLLKIAPDYKISDAFIEQKADVDLRTRIKEPTWFHNKVEAQPYMQVFTGKNGFTPYLSILDLLFNEGPAASNYIGAWSE
jgi:hypothetical protein